MDDDEPVMLSGGLDGSGGWRASDTVGWPMPTTTALVLMSRVAVTQQCAARLIHGAKLSKGTLAYGDGLPCLNSLYYYIHSNDYHG
jgi:hypothetical protein